MNWKLIFAGGLAYYIAAFIVSFATGPLIHEGILVQDYMANSTFWRPELNQDPPDMAALMPLWITTGLITSFIIAGLYGVLRNALSGAGWLKGAKFGLCLWLIHASAMASWHGVFNLPVNIWLWWGIEALIYTIVGSIALGAVGERLAPAARSL